MDGPFTYVALGDSTGVGVGARQGGYVDRIFARLLQARPDARLRNICRSGATSRRVLHTQVARVRAYTPSLITLCVGFNDLTRRRDPEVFAATYRRIVMALRAVGAPLVLVNIPNPCASPLLPFFLRRWALELVVNYNAHIHTIAAPLRIPVVDAFSCSTLDLPRHPEFYAPDRFHPSDEGYAYWAEKMWPVVEDTLALPSAAPRVVAA